MVKLCFIGNSHLEQFLVSDNEIVKLYCLGASIKGLVNDNSRLKLKEQILNFQECNKDYMLLFNLGQVDVEFGYYYKCVKDDTEYNFEDYCDELINKYELFLKSNIHNSFKIISINPPVIKDIYINFRVSFKCPNGKDGYYSEVNDIGFEQVKKYYKDTYEERYNKHKIFNHKLEQMCIKNNFEFIDLWNVLIEDGKVKLKYYPNTDDHHLNVNDTSLTDYVLKKIN